MPDEPTEPIQSENNAPASEPINFDQEPSTELVATPSVAQPPQPVVPARTSEPTFNQPATFAAAAPGPEAPTQPAFSSSQPVAPAPLSVKPPKKKKGLLIGIIVAIIVLLAAGTVLAYKLWYQNPQKVVTDALVHAVTAKSVVYTGTLNVDSGSSKVRLDVTGKQDGEAGSLDAKVTITADDKDYTLNSSALIDKSGDLYVKVEHLSDIMNEYKKQFNDPSERAAISPLLDKLEAKIDGVWIKISSDDLKDFSDSYATTKACTSDAIKKFQNDKSVSSEVTDLYKKHQFITIDKELGAKDGSLGYEISGNKSESKAFVLGLKDTKIYKQLHDCDSSFTIDADDLTQASSDSDTSSTVTVWVSRWTHEFTNVAVSGDSDDSKIDMNIKPKFDQSVSVQTPAKSTTLGQLKTDIEAILQSAYESAYGSSMSVSADSSSKL